MLGFSPPPGFQNRNLSLSNNQPMGPEAILGLYLSNRKLGVVSSDTARSIRFHPYPGHVPRGNRINVKETKMQVSELPFVFISGSFVFICSCCFQLILCLIQFRSITSQERLSQQPCSGVFYLQSVSSTPLQSILPGQQNELSEDSKEMMDMKMLCNTLYK